MEEKTEIARQHMPCFKISGMGWFYRYMSLTVNNVWLLNRFFNLLNFNPYHEMSATTIYL